MSSHNPEELIPLTRAAKLLPGRVGRISPMTVWRWAAKGLLTRDGRRIRLRTQRVGKMLFTKSDWMAEFQAAISPLADTAMSVAPRTPTARQRASDRARRELERMGI